MGRTLRGELRKLRHPVAAIIVIVCFAFILTDARSTYNYARLQVPIAILSIPHLTEASGACQPSGDAVTAHCQSVLDKAADGDSFAVNGIALARVTNSLSTWPGMLRFVSHELATGLGWILLAVLIGIHVAGEWSSRTAGSTLVATASRPRFWLAKIGSVWIAMVGIAVLGTTVLYLTRAGYMSSVGIPAPLDQHGDPSTWHLSALPPDPTWSSWATSTGVLGLTSLIWLLLVLIGVTFAGLIRRTLATVAVLITALATMFAFARYSHRTDWSPISVINRVLNLDYTPFGVRDTRLWSVPGAPSSIQDGVHSISVETTQVLTWIAVPLIVALMALLASSRRRVRG
jgi:hypothetical protein